MLGNTTVEVSVNGQEFTSSGLLVENIALANVTDVMPGVVPVTGGSSVVVRGLGLSASGLNGVFCGFGASTTAETWSISAGTVLSSSSVRCVVPVRGAGMRSLEIALSKDGEMSRSGKQVEYAGVGSVKSV